MRTAVGVIALQLAFTAPVCLAFDEGTHARMSDAAVARSKLAIPNVTASLGLWKGSSSFLGQHYLDFVSDLDASIVARRANAFEIAKNRMPGAEGGSNSPERDVLPFYVKGWIMRGVIREDDGRTDVGSNPQDDPSGTLNRFCNHFYDPLYNVKLITPLCMRDGITSAPLWATGVLPFVAAPGGITKPLSLSVKDQGRRNHYTLQDAREAMWRALTLRSFKGQSGAVQIDQTGRFKDLLFPVHQTIGASPFSRDAVKAMRQIRHAYWATTFFAIGSMLHLNQDMAQPQHTRPEVHPALEPKEFERYFEARALAKFEPMYRSWYHNLMAEFSIAPLSYEPANGKPLPAPTFLELSDFWSTNTVGAGILSGLGLADFSNANFFTAVHNFGNPSYPEPPSDISRYRLVRAFDAVGAAHTYLDAPVIDPLYGTSAVIHKTRPTVLANWLASIGLVSPPLTPEGSNRFLYTLDTTIFDDYAKLLIPRAVAYSAGLINWFFRGSLEISAPDEGVYALVDHTVEADKATGGFRIMKMKVANTTPGESMGAGYLTAVVKFHRDECYVPDLATNRPVDHIEAFDVCRSPEEEITVSKPVAISGLSTMPEQFTFEFPDKLPINATDLYLQVVFRGRLGSEPDSVVVGMKDLYEPTHIGYQNDTDYVSLGEQMYTLQEALAAGVPLLIRISPQTCVMFPPHTIATPCFFEDTLLAGFEFGTKPARAVVDGLPVRSHLRVSYLADTPTTTLRTGGTCNGGTFEVNNTKWQVDEPGGRNIIYRPAMSSTRGIVNQWQVSCFWFGDRVGPSTEDWRQQMKSIASNPPTRLTILEY